MKRPEHDLLRTPDNLTSANFLVCNDSGGLARIGNGSLPNIIRAITLIAFFYAQCTTTDIKMTVTLFAQSPCSHPKNACITLRR